VEDGVTGAREGDGSAAGKGIADVRSATVGLMESGAALQAAEEKNRNKQMIQGEAQPVPFFIQTPILSALWQRIHPANHICIWDLVCFIDNFLLYVNKERLG